MIENKIMIEMPEDEGDTLTFQEGRDYYSEVKADIDIDCINVICFSDNIISVISSFFTGFFWELNDSDNPNHMSPGEIREHFKVDENAKCFEIAKAAFDTFLKNLR